MNNKNLNLQNIILTGLMMAMVFVMTYSIRVPVPATNGYIHLGDSMIFISVIILGWKYGAISASFGSALSDLMAGYPHYIIPTFIIKGLMAIVMGMAIDYGIKKIKSHKVFNFVLSISMIIGGAIMVIGYYLAESFMYGSFLTPLGSIGPNIIQFAGGIIIALPIVYALEYSAGNHLFYHISKNK